VPAGKTWYWAGVNQPSRDLVSLRQREFNPVEPELQAAVAVEHGVDRRTSAGVLARTMLLEDEQLTFVEGSVRRSIGSSLVEVGIARESTGGKRGACPDACQIRIGERQCRGGLGQGLPFVRRQGDQRSRRPAGRGAPIRIGRTVVPAHTSVRYLDRPDGSGQLEAAARLSATFQRFNLAADVRYRQQYLVNGPAPPAEMIAGLIGTGRIGDVRLRGATSFEISPTAKFRTAELAAYWSAGDTTDWEGALAYDRPQNRARARISHIRRFNSLALAVTGEAATDGSLAIALNLNFSIDPANGFAFSRRPIAGAGSVRARVYLDLNNNGGADPGEPFEKGVLVTTGTMLAERATDSKGAVMVAGLPTFSPVTVGIDRTRLSDPMLAPRKALQVVVPRPGVPVTVEIGLVGAGDVEGAIVRNGGMGFEGLDVELVDASGSVVGRALTDYDGYFLFDGVAYGSYRVRLSSASADVAGAKADLDLSVTVSDERPVVRLGAISLQPRPPLASAQ
jgi:hypothetical protein